jgi:hypothetical protein
MVSIELSLSLYYFDSLYRGLMSLNVFICSLIVNYPVLTNGASPPRDEDFLLLPGNLLYTPLKRECIAEVPCPQALRAVPTPHEVF